MVLRVERTAKEKIILFHESADADLSDEEIYQLVQRSIARRVRFKRLTWQVGNCINIYKVEGSSTGMNLCMLVRHVTVSSTKGSSSD